MIKKTDYLIVGQGIAGTLLSYFLMKRGRSVLLVDQYNPSSSSQVAAGLYNPITGRRCVKTWMANEIFPFAETTYREMEQFLNGSFYHPINLLKLFSNKQEEDDWAAKSAAPEMAGYVVNGEVPRFTHQCIDTSAGSAELQGTGYVDMAKLVGAYRARVLNQHLLSEAAFNYLDLTVENNSVLWKHVQPSRIIFCEGHRAAQNPFFSWLPFVPAKGEVLTIHADELKLDKIVNKGIFILPLGANLYRVGSTYTWDDLNEIPTLEGKEELTGKLGKLIKCPYTIVAHRAGIRPTVKDRRPLIGLHPTLQNIGIFNGLGTKGASLAPYFAHHFAAFLEDGTPLAKPVDIRRFYA